MVGPTRVAEGWWCERAETGRWIGPADKNRNQSSRITCRDCSRTDETRSLPIAQGLSYGYWR